MSLVTFVYDNKTINCIISADNVHIMNSSRITKSADMKAIIKIIRVEAEKLGFKYKRSVSSWLNEWKAHNFLSERNVESDRTSSADLNEDEALLRRFGYFILALFYRG